MIESDCPIDQSGSHLYSRMDITKPHFSPTLGENERVQALRSDGIPVLHLGSGESPFPVHPILQAALAQNSMKNMYLSVAGLPELRRLAGAYFADKLCFSREEVKVVIGPGSKALLYAIQLSVRGDLLLPIPSWVSYGPQAGLVGDNVIRIPTKLAENFTITASSLENAILDSRLVICDYNGEAALAFFRIHYDGNAETLVNACCPNIKLAAERLGNFFTGMRPVL